MESAPFLSGDGTFEITASTRFAQCWIIMTKVEKSAVPVAFFLLPSKEQLCYKVMFEALREASVDRRHQPRLLAAGLRGGHDQRPEGGLREPGGGQWLPGSLEEDSEEEGARAGLGGGYQSQLSGGEVGEELECVAACPYWGHS